MALTLGQLKKLINELGSEFDDLEVGRLVNEGATWGRTVQSSTRCVCDKRSS